MNKICGYTCEHNKGGVCQITICDKIGEITTTTQWLSGGRQQGKTYQLIKDQQKEIERLNKEKDYLDDYNRHLYNENKKLNNIIDLVVKDMEMTKYNPELPTYNSCVAVDKDHIQQWIDKLKALKEGK